MAPNPIDFDKVWENFGKLGETGNFVVLATVCSIFGVYFIGLVFARRADKSDEMKVRYSFLCCWFKPRPFFRQQILTIVAF